jgi:hypothetical protein
LSTRQARLNSTLQSRTTQCPESASKAAQATTFSVPFAGRDVFFGSEGGNHDHIVPAIGLKGDEFPEFTSWSGELTIGDNPQDTIDCSES